jgi:hypothetical protein
MDFKFEYKDKESGKTETGMISKIIDSYYEAINESEKIKEYNLFNILEKRETQEFNSKINKICKNLEMRYDSCMRAGNALKCEGDTEIFTELSNDNLSKSYRDLASAIIEYYETMNIYKPIIKKNLHRLVPDISQDKLPNLSTNSITNDIKSFIQENIEDILLNKQISKSYKLRIIDGTKVSIDEKSAKDLVRLLSNKQIDMHARKKIPGVIAELGGNETVNRALVRLHFNEQIEYEVHYEISNAIAKTGDIRDLVELLSNKQIRSNAYSAITRAIAETDGIRNLVKLLSDERIEEINPSGEPREEKRTQIINTISKTDNNKSIIRDLAALLPNERVPESIRHKIPKIIAKAGDRTVARTLVALLPDEHIPWLIRHEITRMIAESCDKTLIPSLTVLSSNLRINAQLRYSIDNTIIILNNKLYQS